MKSTAEKFTDVTVEAETDEALLIDLGPAYGSAWLPKSQICNLDGDRVEDCLGFEIDIYVPNWILKQID